MEKHLTKLCKTDSNNYYKCLTYLCQCIYETSQASCSLYIVWYSHTFL